MPELIFHHYPTSPYSEKVRLAFGVKGVAWRSVTIPNVMPKPDLIALTGGYRKTPVLQLGADVYCDTALIVRELERQFPANPLYPTPQAEILANWAEAKTFGPGVGITFAHIGDTLTPEFKEDRAKFSGRDFSPERMRAALPYLCDQLRAALTLYDELLGDGRAFLLGPAPTVGDFGAYHPLWFITTRIGKPVAPLPEFPRVLAWMERVKAIGHGTPSDLDSAEALRVAQGSTPAPAADSQDPDGRKPGERVAVTPDDTGRDPSVGELVSASSREIIIRRTDARAGTVHVHFPRLGFIVTKPK